MPKALWIPVVVALVATAWPAWATEEELRMQNGWDFPHAGITMAVPQGYQPQPPGDGQEILRAVRADLPQGTESISLSATLLGEGPSEDAVADQMAAQAAKAQGLRDLAVLKKTPMSVAALAGSARLMKYTAHGVPTLAARVLFIRRLDEPKVRLGYVLTVESTRNQEVHLLNVLGEVIKTVKLTAVQHPSALEVKDLGAAWKDARHGYGIRVPQGWYLAGTEMGVQLAQTDYLLGGVESLTSAVVAAQVPASTQAETFAKNAMDRAIQAAAAQGKTVSVVWQGKQQVAGRAAYQFVLERRPKVGQDADTPVVIVQRTVCRPAGPDRQDCYSLILVGQGLGADKACAMMDKIASGFEFLPPGGVTTVAATGPATVPTTTPGTTPATMPKPATAPATK